MTDDSPETGPEIRPDGPLLAPADLGGQRLDKWLAGAGLGLSRSRIKALVEEGRLSVNGKPEMDAGAKIIAGATYLFDLPSPVASIPQPEDIPLDVVFEDKHLIVIDKPAGLVVHPAGGSEIGTLVNALLHHCGPELTGIGGVSRPGIVHRLDKDTTGVMVAAKTEAAHTALTAMFAAHDIERAYLAVTRGAPRPLSGRIETRIARSPNDRKKMAVVRDKHFRADHWSDDVAMKAEEESMQGRIAITNYRALEIWGRVDASGSGPAAAMIECRLETGRTHQIRVHLAHVSAPVMGDQIYGKHHWLKAEGKGPAFDRAKEAVKGFQRQALHAAVLGFNHPITGKAMRFERPPHADMQELMTALRALGSPASSS